MWVTHLTTRSLSVFRKTTLINLSQQFRPCQSILPLLFAQLQPLWAICFLHGYHQSPLLLSPSLSPCSSPFLVWNHNVDQSTFSYSLPIFRHQNFITNFSRKLTCLQLTLRSFGINCALTLLSISVSESLTFNCFLWQCLQGFINLWTSLLQTWLQQQNPE